MVVEHLHLEHDGKILLVDSNGSGPVKPVIGRDSWDGVGHIIRLPTSDEAVALGIEWVINRVNRFILGDSEHVVTYATPIIPWPEDWAWKDSVISDSAVDPVARESVYRTIHRIVSKVVITNSIGHILMAKASRGFFTGCWTLPGGFVNYSEHPREAAQREAMEELGIEIEIPDPKAESGVVLPGDDGGIIQTAIFNEEGINWVSFTYRCNADLDGQEIVAKADEIEAAEWFSKEDALKVAVSIFDIEAIKRT
jgi:ADP-ribose pyrophosphatase YjhB (NUDIX family)